jgi:hypothetical protein
VAHPAGQAGDLHESGSEKDLREPVGDLLEVVAREVVLGLLLRRGYYLPAFWGRRCNRRSAPTRLRGWVAFPSARCPTVK